MAVTPPQTLRPKCSGLKLFTPRRCRVTSEVYLHFIRRNNAEQNGAKMTRLDADRYMATPSCRTQKLVTPNNHQTLHLAMIGTSGREFHPVLRHRAAHQSWYFSVFSHNLGDRRSGVLRGGGFSCATCVFWAFLLHERVYWNLIIWPWSLRPSFFGIQRNKNRLILSQYIYNKKITF